MSNLDNLTSKILADAKAQADKIIKDAQEKAQHKYDLEIKKINAKKETVLENARRDRELIDKLKTKLVNMDEKKYINYLNQNIDKNTITGKELIVKKEFAEKVKKKFLGAKVKKNEFVTSGFIIEENGIQENYTFEVKLDFMRDELEVEISKLLFS